MTISVNAVLAKIIAAVKTPFGWFSMFLLYLTPLKDIYVLIIMVVVGDFITGMMASLIAKRPITSSRLKNSVVKCFCYFGAIFLLWQFEIRLGFDAVHTYKGVAGLIAAVEILSVLENMAVITGNPIFLKIVKFLRGQARTQGGDVVGDILEEKKDEEG